MLGAKTRARQQAPFPSSFYVLEWACDLQVHNQYDQRISSVRIETVWVHLQRSFQLVVPAKGLPIFRVTDSTSSKPVPGGTYP
jgi:hypothetical protein